MKKRILTIVATLALAITPAVAQIYLEDEWTDSRVVSENGPGVMIPLEDVHNDQYVPVGEGLFLLGGLGVAYLLGKRKKDE